jgi:hypothetical protein
MQFAIDLIQKIPAGWPRLAMLATIIGAYLQEADRRPKGEGEARRDDAISANEKTAFGN